MTVNLGTILTAMVTPFDAGDQLFHIFRLGVVHPYGNAAAAGCGNQFSGFFDCLRSTGSSG